MNIKVFEGLSLSEKIADVNCLAMTLTMKNMDPTTTLFGCK